MAEILEQRIKNKHLVKRVQKELSDYKMHMHLNKFPHQKIIVAQIARKIYWRVWM